MKMTVHLLTVCVFALAFANPNDQTQIEKYVDKVKTYHLEVPGKKPITIIETASTKDFKKNWEDVKLDTGKNKDKMEIKNLLTHIVHDINGNVPRCYGPSCQEGFNSNDGPQDDYLLDTADKMKDYRDFSQDRLMAISALAEKLKNEKLKADRYSTTEPEESDEEGNGKVYTSWNRMKIKQHKHPYDDKDGWVTLEPVAWSTSKVSKWKPNVKKQKPVNHWNDADDDRFPNDDRYTYQGNSQQGHSYNYPTKKPFASRPSYINNKLHTHMQSEYDSEVPSKPTWNKPQIISSSYPSSWSPDEGRRPHKPHCDSDEDAYPSDDTVLYGISDSVVTDPRPSNFPSNYPYEYEALHQASLQKRPIRRPTQVVYAGSPDLDGDGTRTPNGDGQWVLLSTTRGYRNKKRQRSLNPPADDRSDGYGSMTSHQAVALTVLPVDKEHTNMTTSHGGLLEVEKSFQTVEESKRDMDKKIDLGSEAYQNRPVTNRVIRRRIV